MGSGSSVLAAEAAKPLDGSDLKTDQEAISEVIRLRGLIKAHENAAEEEEAAKPLDGSDLKKKQDARSEVIRLRALIKARSNDDEDPENSDALSPLKERPPSKGRTAKHRGSVIQVGRRKSSHFVDFTSYDSAAANDFTVEDCPKLYDYLVNEFHRFSGQDQVLEWDEFWRFCKDLNLGLSDEDIMALRQKADTNNDGVVEWLEMLSVVEPLMGKVWHAGLQGAQEYEKWTELHWDTHTAIEKTAGGYHRKGRAFYVNKFTGETSWEKPETLNRHSSITEHRKKRSHKKAPTLEDFLTHAFNKHSKNGKHLKRQEFKNAVCQDLHIAPKLSSAEVDRLITEADIDGDGVVDWHEFLHLLTPKLYSIFHERRDANEWVTLSEMYEDGHEYVYWYNRNTGESSWENPNTKAAEVTG